MDYGTTSFTLGLVCEGFPHQHPYLLCALLVVVSMLKKQFPSISLEAPWLPLAPSQKLPSSLPLASPDSDRCSTEPERFAPRYKASNPSATLPSQTSSTQQPRCTETSSLAQQKPLEPSQPKPGTRRLRIKTRRPLQDTTHTQHLQDFPSQIEASKSPNRPEAPNP